MRPLILLSILFASIIINSACRRDKEPLATESNCVQLRNGIVANDKDAVKEVMGDLISKLPNRKYTPANLNKLIEAMNQQCEVITVLSCYSCIHTLPAQSEISVRVAAFGNHVPRVVDISEDTNGDMKFVNMHD